MTRVASFVLACAVGGAALAKPVPKDFAAQLLIVNKKGEKSQLFLTDGSGKNERELTDVKSNASYPAWSPDGKRIAFASDRDGGMYHVFVMDADGKNVTQLTKGTLPCRVPSWSPDGKTVAFCRAVAGGWSDVRVVGVGGGEAKALPSGDGWDPAVSPDGKSIAFVSGRDFDGFRLYTADADGKNPRSLVGQGNRVGFAYPAWSPDGKRIAFGDTVGGKVELHTIDADGKNKTQITKYGGMAAYPSWSADGKRLAALQWKQNLKAELVTLDPDGKNLKVLRDDLTHVEGGRPTWRPQK